jgi:hypothetical protein
MGVCSRSQPRRRADRGEITLQVLCDPFLFCGEAFLFCGNVFLVLFALLALECLNLFRRLSLFRCLELLWS